MFAEKKFVAKSSRNARGAAGTPSCARHVEEHAEERQQVRGLAHEEVVERHVGHDERDAGRHRRQPAEPSARAARRESP